jgi:hypothetical protein
MKYYAVRYKSAPTQPRIEKANTPRRAFHLAFGHPPRTFKGQPADAEYKDLGGRVKVIQSDRKRIALLTEPTGWIEFR